MSSQRKFQHVPRQLIIVIVILAVGFGSAGFTYYQSQKAEFRAHAEYALQSSADWKAGQISEWFEKTYGDARMLINDPFILPGLRHWMENPGDPDEDNRVLSWLGSISEHCRASCAVLLDEEGTVRLSNPVDTEYASELVDHFQTCVGQKEPVVTDLHRSPLLGDIHFELCIPLADPQWRDGMPTGVLLLRIEADRSLYPILQSPLSYSGTSETVLVRRENENVVYLNDLRFRKDTALSLKLPLDSPDLIGAMAAKGRAGVAEGIDYRGVPVLAAMRSVSHWPWFLVVKQDLDEIYAPLRMRAYVMSFFGAALLIIAGACLGLIWSRQRALYYRHQYEAETRRLEIAQRYENLAKFANDIVIMTDPALAICEVNDRAIASYGFSRDELLQMNLADLQADESPADLKEQLRKARAENGYVFEAIHRRKDGSRFPVEMSVRLIRLADRVVYLGILRDISERKQAEGKTLHFNRLYAFLSQVNQLIVRIRDRAELFEGACRIAVRYGGLKMAWIGLPDDGEALRVQACTGDEDGFLGVRQALIDRNPMGQRPGESIAPGGKTFVHRDIRADTPPPVWREEALKRGYRSSASVPLWKDGAVLTLYASEPGFFDQDEVELIEEIARDISFALEKMKQEEERDQAVELLKRSERELSLRNEIANVFLTVSDNETCGEVLGIILRTFESRSGVFSCSDDNGDIVATIATPESTGTAEVSENEVRYSPDAWKDSVWGRAAAVHEGLRWNEPQKIPNTDFTVSSALVVPIAFHAKVIGYLGIANKEADYTASDKDLLEKISSYIAPVLGARQQRNREERERKLAGENLLLSTNRFEDLTRQFNALLDVIPDGLTLHSRDMRIIWANRTAGESVGKDPPDMIGQYCFLVRHDGDEPCDGCPVLESFDTGGPAIGYTSSLDGKSWELRSIPVKDSRGEIAGVVELARDVTEHSKLQHQLQRAQKLEAIGTLAGGIAHDFNNILGIVMGYMELVLCKTEKHSKTWEQLQSAIKAAERAKDLVRQILAFSRGSGEKKQPIRLGQVVKEAFRLLRASLPSTIEIRQDLDLPWGEDTILADSTEIHQILINLCTNAAHAMRETGGKLEVGLSTVHFENGDSGKPLDLNPGDYVLMRVSDTGHGIAPQIVERIFDPYFTTKNRGEGTGLGLAVVHGIVKNSDGAITVSSSIGRGTTFDLFFPRFHGPAAIENGGTNPIPDGNERILFVDDEAALADAGKSMLEQLGYRVLALTGSTAALDAFRDDPDGFGLVITDQTMPQMTGIELAKEIIRIRPGMRIILCTGFSETVSEQIVRNVGIKKLVMKPVMFRELANTVRQVLDGDTGETAKAG